MRRVDFARGIVVTATLLSNLRIGLALKTTCPKVKNASCFLPGNEDKVTLDEFCKEKYGQCPPPKW